MASQAVLELLVNLKDNASSGLASIGGSLKTLGTVGLGVAAGGVAALGASLVSGIGDAREAAQVMAQTEAVIKSTGGAAGLTADEISDMAAQMSAAAGKSLFGDSDIQQAQNLLLTFTNIGEKTFPTATQAMVDMAQAMGTDVKGGAIQLGKALNDPVAGISALTRVGVTFTDQQKEQIEAMVKAGDVAGAQAVILAELNKEFGGSAEAAAKADGGWAQFKDRLGEVAETVGAAFLPLLNQAAGFLNEHLAPALEGAAQWLAAVVEDGDLFNDFMSELPAPVQEVVRAVQGLIEGFHLLVETWGSAGDFTSSFAEQLGATIDLLVGTEGVFQEVGILIQGLIDAFRDAGPVSLEFAEAVGQISPILGGIIQVAAEVLPNLSALVQQVLGDIVAYFQANGAEMLATAQETWTSIQETITSIAGPLAEVVNAVLAQISAFWAANGAEILATVGSVWSQVNQIIQVAMQLIQATIVPVLQFIAGFISAHGSEIQQIFSGAWQIISNVIQAALTLIKGILTAALQAIQGDWSGAWQTIQNMSAQFVTNILGAIQGGLTLIEGAFNSTIGAIRDIWNALVGDAAGIGNDIINGILNGLQSSGNQIISYLQGLASQALQAAKDALGIGSPSREFAEQVGEPMVLGIIKGLNDLTPDLLKTIQSLQTDLLRQISDIDAQLKGKMTDSARRALADQRKELEEQVKAIDKAIEDFPARMHDVMADAFDASASIDRQAAKNIDAVRKLAITMQAQTRGALDEAMQQAEQIQDPEQARRFFQMRSNQIIELAKLQSELQEAQQAGDAQRMFDLSQQIGLIETAQQKERAGMNERLQIPDKRGLGGLFGPIQALFGDQGITIPGDMPPVITQLLQLLAQLGNRGTLPPLPTSGGSAAPGGLALAVPAAGGTLTIAQGAIVIQGYSPSEGQRIAQVVLDEIRKRTGGRF